MKVKKFRCGFCERLKKDSDWRTRKDLRKHLREEHGFTKEITNTLSGDGKIVKRDWWISEEFK